MGNKASNVTAIAGSKATRATVIMNGKNEVTTITGGKETEVTGGECVEIACKKWDHGHEYIKHGRVLGCVDLCLDFWMFWQVRDWCVMRIWQAKTKHDRAKGLRIVSITEQRNPK